MSFYYSRTITITIIASISSLVLVSILNDYCIVAQLAISNWASAQATWALFQNNSDQNQNTTGLCSYRTKSNSKFPFNNYAGVNTIFYANSEACGACYEVKCQNTVNTNCQASCIQNTTAIVQITNKCSGATYCMSTDSHFVLSNTAYKQIAVDDSNAQCVLNVTYRRVLCDYSTTDNIQIVMRASNQYWIGVTVEQVNLFGSITNVQIRDSNSNSYTAWNSIIGVRDQNYNQ
jgi:hypothetical protein